MDVPRETPVLNRIEAKLDELLELVAELKVQKRGPRKAPQYSELFLEWWDVYPVKKGKKECARTWNNKNLDCLAMALIADTQLRMNQEAQWIDGYIPNPQTYLNGDRWEDAINPIQPAKLHIPTGDQALVRWAEIHKFPKPGNSETYFEYRQRLRGLVRQREAT